MKMKRVQWHCLPFKLKFHLSTNVKLWILSFTTHLFIVLLIFIQLISHNYCLFFFVIMSWLKKTTHSLSGNWLLIATLLSGPIFEDTSPHSVVYFVRLVDVCACVCAFMMERCGNERSPDQNQFVPDVTRHNWMSHFTVSPLHWHRQARMGEGIKWGRGGGSGGVERGWIEKQSMAKNGKRMKETETKKQNKKQDKRKSE